MSLFWEDCGCAPVMKSCMALLQEDSEDIEFPAGFDLKCRFRDGDGV